MCCGMHIPTTPNTIVITITTATIFKIKAASLILAQRKPWEDQVQVGVTPANRPQKAWNHQELGEPLAGQGVGGDVGGGAEGAGRGAW